ncbi:hypothetical protein IX38_01290 [Chryseobacterium luteum]|uniref:Uncharacterized protein n=1 Tax=Chryseobacterium luteum TaxID=421531 RepID=A0A085ZXL3_9FLAO|nr:hypothetical protein IX38_01290 [Chryseobacterium luteum]
MTFDTGHPENFNDVHRHNFFEIIWFSHVSGNSSLELILKVTPLKITRFVSLHPDRNSLWLFANEWQGCLTKHLS